MFASASTYHLPSAITSEFHLHSSSIDSPCLDGVFRTEDFLYLPNTSEEGGGEAKGTQGLSFIPYSVPGCLINLLKGVFPLSFSGNPQGGESSSWTYPSASQVVAFIPYSGEGNGTSPRLSQ